MLHVHMVPNHCNLCENIVLLSTPDSDNSPVNGICDLKANSWSQYVIFYIPVMLLSAMTWHTLVRKALINKLTPYITWLLV